MTDSDKADKLIYSLSKETRYCILECSVFIEEKISETLGRLLEIDWRESESLGFGSGGLGFDNKVRLIQDLKRLKDDRAKFQSFMAIRNKFAHIAEIDSFDAFFKLVKSGKQRKKELETWYPNLKWQSIEGEEIYKFAYLLLTLDLFQILFETDVKYISDKAIVEGRTDATEKFVTTIKLQLEETEEGKKILQQTIDQLYK